MNRNLLLESCIRIKNLDEFKPFREWLTSELDGEMNVLVSATDEVVLRLAQGSARRLRSILDLLDAAAKQLDKGRP